MLRVATAGTGKKISLELGGKSPVIVFHNADLDSAGFNSVVIFYLREKKLFLETTFTDFVSVKIYIYSLVL